MPTIISHTVVAVAAGKAFTPKDVPSQFWLLSIVCSIIPDFDNTRYFFPWTPIVVSPLSIRGLLSHLGMMAIQSELLWVWLPSFIIVTISRLVRTVSAKY